MGTGSALTYDQVVELAYHYLKDQRVGTSRSAVQMEKFLDEVEGREIVTPGHEAHTHEIREVQVNAGGNVFEIALLVTPCPQEVTVLLLKVCPECAVGKCQNCDGNTWDPAKDDLAPCPCAVAEHRRQ